MLEKTSALSFARPMVPTQGKLKQPLKHPAFPFANSISFAFTTFCDKLWPIMLQFFRHHTKAIVWVSAICFILCGGYSITTLKKEGRFAGEVFGKSVTFQEYNLFYRATQLFMPSEKPIDDPDLLRNYTWQNVIYARESKREGIKVSDQDVRSEISVILKQQGLIDPTPQQYNIWLTRALRMTPREFEEGLREFIRIQKLLRTKIASLGSPEALKSEDAKVKEEALQKQKDAFIKWTSDLNEKAKLKDYLSLPETSEEEPTAEDPPLAAPVPKVASKK